MASEQNISASKPKKIFLWMVPRSLSTSFEKCVGFMDGAQIWHEPYIGAMLNSLFSDEYVIARFPGLKSWLKHFAKSRALIEASDTYEGGNLYPASYFKYDWVKEQLEKPIAEGKKFMFIKDAAFAIDGHYDMLPEMERLLFAPTLQEEVQHTFLIRHPNRIAKSLRPLYIHLFEHKGDPDDYDLSAGHPFMAWERLSPNPLFKLWNHVRENIHPNPVVIDADDLQTHPGPIMRKYCEAVGIPFKEEYLKWDASDESLKYFYGSLDQMVWGRSEGVYDAAFLSSCFLPLKSEIPPVPPKCEGYVQEFLEGYKIMYAARVKP